MALTIGLNIASLQAQRRLAENSSKLSQIYERLSSGQRINAPSDDPAGLSISSTLRADAKVYSQGIRNLNDGISLLNVGQSALDQLSSITQRQFELAEQAANGSYTYKQRLALHKENFELVKEFNRIIESTTFNGIKILDGSLKTGLALQAGYGANGMLIGRIGEELSRTVGDGTFNPGASYNVGAATGVYDMQTGDFNGDGIDDIAGGSWTGGAWIRLGVGDGTFGAQTTIAGLAQTKRISVADINGDGKDDLITVADSGIRFLTSNGNGTFTQTDSDTASGFYGSMATVGDYNGDGKVDFMATDINGTGYMVMYTGNGDGTFASGQTVGNTGYAYNAVTGDVNGDGRDDFAVADITGTYIFLNNGSGGFTKTLVRSGDYRSIALNDINGDGVLDLIAGRISADTLDVSLGNGNGTFQSANSYSIADGGMNYTYQEIVVGDFNGDGKSDVGISLRNTLSSAGTISLFIGNGDGTLGTRKALDPNNTYTDTLALTVGDFNRDGVTDIVAGTSWSTVRYFQGNTTESTLIAWQDLTTVENARTALDILRPQLDRITLELGAIGALQSRAKVAVNMLTATVEAYKGAESRIMDADIAADTAEMIKLKILQDVGAAILAQANIQPKIALSLLKDLD